VSLILEALRKLEREKRSSEPGFLVLGPTSWAGGTRGPRAAMLVLIAGLALLATALGLLAWRNASGGSAPAARVAAAPPPPPADSPVAAPGGYVPQAHANAPVPIPLPTPRSAPTLLATPAAAPADALAHAAHGPPPTHVAEPPIQALSAPPGPPSQAEQPRFRLQAISVRDGKPVAVLNDRLVYEGESVDGVKVVRIGEAEVELEIDGRRQVISF
jgi:hypothetical protein